MWSSRDHGPLPWMLLGLTVGTGLVDAVSILQLGRVFVANMTGKLVFVGFALAGAKGLSLGASLCALAGFVVGALTGGRIIRAVGADRARMIREGATLELVLAAATMFGGAIGGAALVLNGDTSTALGFAAAA